MSIPVPWSMMPDANCRHILTRVKENILAHPENFRMDRWNCGTAACIAGHVCLLKFPDLVPLDNIAGFRPAGAQTGSIWSQRYYEDEAASALGLTMLQARALFYKDRWPQQFANQYSELLLSNGNGVVAPGNYEAAAQIAARRIDHFLETGE